MAYVTWADATSTWTTDVTKWSSQLYPVTATLNSTNTLSQSNTAQFVGNISLLQAILTQLNEEDRESSVYGVLANSLGVSATVSVAVPKSASFDTSHTITETDTLQAVGDITLSKDLDISSTGNAIFISAADLTQLLLSETHSEDLELAPFSVRLSSDYGIIASVNVIIPQDVSLDLDTSTKNNVNYPHAVTADGRYSITAVQRLLWEDETEASTTWTEVTENTDGWVIITENTDSWTKQ